MEVSCNSHTRDEPADISLAALATIIVLGLGLYLLQSASGRAPTKLAPAMPPRFQPELSVQQKYPARSAPGSRRSHAGPMTLPPIQNNVFQRHSR